VPPPQRTPSRNILPDISRTYYAVLPAPPRATVCPRGTTIESPKNLGAKFSASGWGGRRVRPAKSTGICGFFRRAVGIEIASHHFYVSPMDGLTDRSPELTVSNCYKAAGSDTDRRAHTKLDNEEFLKLEKTIRFRGRFWAGRFSQSLCKMEREKLWSRKA
jgi:hypothetical protein